MRRARTRAHEVVLLEHVDEARVAPHDGGYEVDHPARARCEADRRPRSGCRCRAARSISVVRRRRCAAAGRRCGLHPLQDSWLARLVVVPRVHRSWTSVPWASQASCGFVAAQCSRLGRQAHHDGALIHARGYVSTHACVSPGRSTPPVTRFTFQACRGHTTDPPATCRPPGGPPRWDSGFAVARNRPPRLKIATSRPATVTARPSRGGNVVGGGHPDPARSFI